ncbi:MAG: HU family DNA-binding protein, partial [Deltaproteobacteria bacterium]|nr:HU family DNA-binding protein [Deltaproteobacteria bacterium]
MNKLKLIETIKDETGLTKTEAKTVVNVFFDKMAGALA